MASVVSSRRINRNEPLGTRNNKASMNSEDKLTRRHCRSQDSAKVVRSDPPAADRDPSRLGQLECNRRCGDWSVARANRTSQLDGVALTGRNSHQINRRLQPPCRAADENRQRYLAKECVGSNRGRQERLQLPAATTTELNPIRSVHRQNENAREPRKRR